MIFSLCSCAACGAVAAHYKRTQTSPVTFLTACAVLCSEALSCALGWGGISGPLIALMAAGSVVLDLLMPFSWKANWAPVVNGLAKVLLLLSVACFWGSLLSGFWKVSFTLLQLYLGVLTGFVASLYVRSLPFEKLSTWLWTPSHPKSKGAVGI